MRALTIYTILWLFFSLSVCCQEVPKVISFRRSDYHAAHQNWMIAQDCSGYLYVANTAGVLIFNGFRWQLVTMPKKHIPRALFKGEDCKIYTGGYEFFGYISMADRHHPRYIPVADSLLDDREIWHIFGTDETLLFQSFSDLFEYNYHRIRKVDLPENIMLGSVVSGEFYIPRIRRGLFKYDQEILEIEAANQLPVKTKITALCPSEKAHELIVATQNDGLFRLDGQGVQAISSELNNQLKQEQINKMIRLTTGDYVIGTILNGVYITNNLREVKYHIRKSNGLLNNTVLSLFEDQHRNLWVGLDKGLNLLRVNQPAEYYYDIQGKLGTVFTSTVYEQDLYLGTNQGVFKKTPDGSFLLIENSQGQIWSFLIADGDLLCGHNTGTFQIKNDAFIQVSEVTGGWWMKALQKDRVLQSTYTGLVLLEKKKDRWQLRRRVAGGDLLIQKFILIDHLLTGYHPNYGICLLKLSEDYSEVLEEKIIESFEGLDLRAGTQLLASEKASVIALDESFFMVDDLNIRRISDREQQELSSDDTFQEEKKFYLTQKEMSETEGVSWSVFYTYEKQLSNYLFGLDEGYVLVPKTWKRDNQNLTELSLDYVTVNDSLIPWHGRELCLQPRENDISIYLKTNGHFGRPVSDYQYRLAGWAQGRYPITPGGRIDFYNLNDGSYQLWLSGEGMAAEKRLISFKIKPHWYESWAGFLLYVSLGLLLIWFLNKRHEANLKAETRKLREEKEQALESERIQAKNEKLEREVIYKSKMLANSTMTLIQKNKMLHQLKEFIGQEYRKGSLPGQKKQKVLNLIDRNINSDRDWEIFEKNFAEVHQDFLEKLKLQHPDITAGELRLAAYIRLDLSSKEIAPLLNISIRSVENKRYRLRKRMNIEREDSLKNYLMRL